jgi:hypothetical protein
MNGGASTLLRDHDVRTIDEWLQKLDVVEREAPRQAQRRPGKAFGLTTE